MAEHTRISLKDMLLEAIEVLDEHGKSPVTQAQIAQQLRVSSQKLNKSRQDALNELVQDGDIDVTVKPNDARNIRLYSLCHNGANQSDAKQSQIDDIDFYEDRFYTALFAYLDHYARFPKAMQYVPEFLSPEEWLAKARQFARILAEQHGLDKYHEIEQLLEWVKQGAYDEAWQHIRKEGARVDNNIRNKARV